MAQPGRLSPQRMIPSEAEFPNGVSPRRRTALSIDRVGTKATELMGTARTRRGSLVPRPIGERTESPERSRMGRRMTRIKTQKFLGTDLRIPRGRAESLLYTYGEDDDLQPSSRRPSSLPGGLNSLESSGSGLGYYFKDKLKDLESAMQPELRNRALTEDLRRDLLALPKFKESKEMGHAVEEGYITEDFSRLIFDKFKNEAEPEFLQDLTLEVTGGLNMVAEIPLKEKYLWFIVLLVSVVFNVSYLLHLDWAIFKTYLTEVFGTFDPRLIADRLSNGGGSESRKEIQAQLLDDKSFKASIFGLISDQQTRMMIVNAAVMVAIWEVAWLCFQFVHALYLLGLVCLAKSEYKRFNAVGYFFQKLLPQVSTFSAVKLLARVHPSLLSHEYRIWVSESSEKLLCGHRRNTIGYVMLTITFVIFNICCAMASVSAFSVKMLAVSFKLVNPEVPTWLRLASILATLNQVVGAVYLERVLQDRIFLFVFGGRDATYEDDELAYRNAYETRLMKEIWVQYWHKKNPATGCRTWPQTALNALNAVVLLATLDHYDLQYLMVEDPEGEMDLFERLGLVESSQDAPQRSVSAPDDLSPSKRKKSNQSNVHKEKQDTSTCASLCNLLPCAAPVRVSSPELRAVPEESESPSPSRVNSPQGAESVVDAKDAFAGAVELVDETKQDAAVVPSAEPVDEADAFGPVCSEQDQQTCILTESVATHRPSWEPREDASESSQPLLCSEDGRIPPEHPNRVEDGESSVTSSRSGMEALTRLLGTAVGHWGDGWSETPQSRSRRSRHLAWGDGFSEMSRSETKESFDWDAMFSPQVRRGDDLV